MSANVYEVTQYAASCRDCAWYGDVYTNEEDLAVEDMVEHNRMYHSKF